MQADKIKVLLVDDHVAFRDSIARFINDQPDMSVIGTAADGQEAIKQASELQPDVILMDVMMPGLDGIEAMKQIINNRAASVIMLSAYSYDAYLLASMKAGAKGYLDKSGSVSEILEAVRLVHAGRNIFDNKALSHALNHIQDLNYDIYLSDREIEIVKLLADGLTNREIAEQIGLNPRSVQTTVTGILRKLGAKSRTEAVLKAVQEGWVVIQ